ncbi:MAG: universal stress protein [Caldilineaceae bacterium]|nr:universal stress protein [Caldilineaceae bacterium]
MYKTILVPLDGSPRAEAILPHVEEMARLYKANVVLLCVVEPVITMIEPYGMAPDYGANLAEMERRNEEARVYLEGKQGEFRDQGIQTKVYVENGPVVARILDIAQQESADLIAMASHGRSGISRVFYGSVAAGVLQQADRPLLLVRALDA